MPIPSSAYDSEHFYTTRETLTDFFSGKKQWLMENFYRMMRKKHHILVINDQPVGGQWNFDAQNRKKYNQEIPIPFPLNFSTDVREVLSEIKQTNIKYFGTIDASQFSWPSTRFQALEVLNYFCDHMLEHFGTYQDALYSDHKYLFHSRLSFALNLKMITPDEVIQKVITYYYNHQDEISIAQVEGFIRQILGWREYIRGIYWAKMPAYAQSNHLQNYRALPEFFWTGKTKMKCLQHALTQSLTDAYAHHIQRLMIIGNFSLLAQIHPEAVDQWYLGVYIDAIEWVEMPNTRGMSQYADGGIVATKPYISSGSYINKMSNYCGSCRYNVKEKTTNNACPFNSLYWYFLHEKRPYFENNQRMRMMLNVLDKMDATSRNEIYNKAISLLESIEHL